MPLVPPEEWRQLSDEAHVWARRTWIYFGVTAGSFLALASRVEQYVPAPMRAGVLFVSGLGALVGVVLTTFSMGNYVYCSKLFRKALRRRFHGQGIVWQRLG
jgi:hypothetical protein